MTVRTLLAVILSLALAAGCGSAASPIDGSTAHGIMKDQLMTVLGAWTVSCDEVASHVSASASEVACARVPGSMFGFFREAVHGRMYEYLRRKTVVVLHDWSTQGDVLRVDYVVDRGVFSVERERIDGKVYAVFLFQRSTSAAAPPRATNP